MEVFINAIGLAAPGLSGWQNSLSTLRGEKNYFPEPLEKYKPEQLPANERRRATNLVRMAFRVCEDLLVQHPEIDIISCAAVFSSSGGDYPIIDQICKALCEKERFVSPTQFHNSVHNSAAGYWSIATGSRAPSTSISAYDDSFSTGLLEAATLCLVEQIPTLLAVYDICPPEPLQSKRPITADFGVAILLSPISDANSIAQLNLQTITTSRDESTSSIELENLRLANPAARCLPLLEFIAAGKSGKLHLSNNSNPTLQLEVRPC